MNRKFAAIASSALITLAACGGSGSGSSDTMAPADTTATTMAQGSGGTYKSDKGTVAQIALTTPGFTSLVAAVLQGGLLTTLSGDGPFTVLAPTDDAFAKLPKALVDKLFMPQNNAVLVKILTYHVVAGKLLKADLKGEVATVEGQKVAFAGGGATVNGAKIVASDVLADNGVVHVIDSVLVPPGLDVGSL